jgi:hypothetical protein
MPHSHNDPGWLKTVEGYFATATKNILNNIVNKLTLHTNMTFIWSEVGTTNTYTGGQGCGSGSVLDPDSIGSVDPEPGGQK